MMKTPRIVFAVCLLTGVLAPSLASAQTTSQASTITTRKLSAPVALNFSSTINPNTLNTAATASMNATLATAHQKARESTLLGIYYLRSNQTNILAGNDAIYNDVFGSYYDKNNDFFKQQIYLIDNTHFLQVHNTYASIRTQLDNPVTFNGGAQLNPATLTAADAASTAVFGNTYGWRHWGFSNTGDPGVSPAGVSPGTQLRWMDDNDPVLGLRFYNEKLDIYGLPNNPSQQYVGKVFFTEMERPSDRYGLGTTPSAGTMTKTELNREQMLIASFSEFRTGFTNPNIPVGPPVVITQGGAFYGLRAMERFSQPNGSPNFYDAYDAENFGRFIKRLAEIGLDDVRKLPPLNKNAQFRPIVLAPATGS
jgi:hypothetical protein